MHSDTIQVDGKEQSDGKLAKISGAAAQDHDEDRKSHVTGMVSQEPSEPMCVMPNARTQGANCRSIATYSRYRESRGTCLTGRLNRLVDMAVRPRARRNVVQLFAEHRRNMTRGSGVSELAIPTRVER